jgi:hypothetical protein
MENLPSSRQDFMAIGLVSHIPDDLVIGCMENIMEGYGKFYHPKARAEVSRIGRYNLYDKLPKLGTKLK